MARVAICPCRTAELLLETTLPRPPQPFGCRVSLKQLIHAYSIQVLRNNRPAQSQQMQQMQNQQPQHLGVETVPFAFMYLEGQSGRGLSKEWRLFSNPASLKHLELGKSSADSLMYWIPRQAQHQQSNFQQFPQQPSNFQQFPQQLCCTWISGSALERLRNFQGMGQQGHSNYNMQQGNMQQGNGGCESLMCCVRWGRPADAVPNAVQGSAGTDKRDL